MESSLYVIGTASPGELFRNILPWAIALLGLALLGAVAIYIARRVVKSNENSSTPGFTLQSLREMRDSGEITEQEYQRARESLIGQVKGSSTDESQSDDESRFSQRSDNAKP